MSTNTKVDFKDISAKIFKNFLEHERNIKQLCQKTTLIALSDFYDDFQREVKEINSEITPSKDSPTIADFADIFKAFDEYPTNIQKPKKITTKERPRLNSTIMKGSSSSLAIEAAIAAPRNNFSSSINLPRLDECATAIETYSDFKKFSQKLNQLNTELQQRELEQDYALKLRQLSTFARQLEKLLPAERIGMPAFTAAEEEKLRHLENELDDLNFIRSNQNVFQNVANGDYCNSITRLENLVELLTYAQMAVSCYNGAQH